MATSPPDGMRRNSAAAAAAIVLLTALAYAAAGGAALMLAGPPGYASPLYPSAGIALAAVLVYGARAVPGVWLGAFAVNAGLGLLRGQQGWALVQSFRPGDDAEARWESSEDAVVVARNHAALADLAQSGKWTTADPFKARPWTDDYMNLIGALYGNLRARWSGER